MTNNPLQSKQLVALEFLEALQLHREEWENTLLSLKSDFLSDPEGELSHYLRKFRFAGESFSLEKFRDEMTFVFLARPDGKCVEQEIDAARRTRYWLEQKSPLYADDPQMKAFFSAIRGALVTFEGTQDPGAN